MSADFQPELGQLFFSSGVAYPFSSPYRDEQFLLQLSEILGIGEKQGVFSSNPFNSGSFGVEFPSFIVEGYSWSDEYEQPFNFHFKPLDYYVSWYKYLGRSQSCNKKLTDSEYLFMVKRCIEEAVLFTRRKDLAEKVLREGLYIAQEYMERKNVQDVGRD